MDVKKSFRAAKNITASQKYAIKELEDMFVDIADNLNNLAESREKSLCLTKLQEAKFWAVECVAKVWTREDKE